MPTNLNIISNDTKNINDANLHLSNSSSTERQTYDYNLSIDTKFHLKLVIYLLILLDILYVFRLLYSQKITSPWFQKKGLKIACLNIHHLIPKLDQIKLSLTDQHPDIIGLCETFLDDKVDKGEVGG